MVGVASPRRAIPDAGVFSDPEGADKPIESSEGGGEAPTGLLEPRLVAEPVIRRLLCDIRR